VKENLSRWWPWLWLLCYGKSIEMSWEKDENILILSLEGKACLEGEAVLA
jgi:hypothetical protein